MARTFLLLATQLVSTFSIALQSDHVHTPHRFQGVQLIDQQTEPVIPFTGSPVSPIFPESILGASPTSGASLDSAAATNPATSPPGAAAPPAGPVFLSSPSRSSPIDVAKQKSRILKGLKMNATRNAFTGVLGFKGHKGPGVFSDFGAWHGFGLPDRGFAGGFAGPYVHGQFVKGHWISPTTLVRFTPIASAVEQGVPRERRVEEGLVKSRFVPGALRQEYTTGDFQIASELIFIGPRTAAVRVRMLNAGGHTERVVVQFNGSASVPLETDRGRRLILANLAPSGEKSKDGDTTGASVQAEVRFDPALNITTRIGLHGYIAKSMNETILSSEEEGIAYYTVSVTMNYKEALDARALSDQFFLNPMDFFTDNRLRWEKYMDSVVGTVDGEPTLPQRIATKAVCTLLINWRGAQGTEKHDGLVPSMAGYNNGYWSWDSWKHAAALALFDTDLAQNQILAVFDHQGKEVPEYHGMIPDKVGLAPNKGDAWGNTKPPLSAWAVWQVYFHGKNRNFLKEMLPKLERYHNWWYKWRDHDGNGLCEYGATGANSEEMKWESGMDNAPRFDKTKLVRNSDHAWSADQESVDLNSYLYAEKRLLATMASELGLRSKAAAFSQQAKDLRKHAQERFFDEKRGYFFDRKLGHKSAFVGPMGCEGFVPLWAGLASEKQASRVREHLMNANKFRTKVPFPCVAANEPEFKAEGYWRGPVWLDQAYFALHGLRRYGFEDDADKALNQLLKHAEGLGTGDPSAPFTENYNPHTGKSMGMQHFGWSAAHMLLLTATEHPSLQPEEEQVTMVTQVNDPEKGKPPHSTAAKSKPPEEPKEEEPEEPIHHH